MDNFGNHYVDWQKSRTNAIEKYLPPNFFRGKSVHEIGCGHAFFGNYAHEKGASNVFVTDARQEHIDIVKQKHPLLNSSVLDVDDITQLLNMENVDVIIHFGVLYHIKNVVSNLQTLSTKCKYMILETEVCDSDDATDNLSVIERIYYDQAYHGIGSRPSQQFVESILNICGFLYRCILDPILDTNCHNYSWEIKNTKKWKGGQRRFWICWKKDIDIPIYI